MTRTGDDGFAGAARRTEIASVAVVLSNSREFTIALPRRVPRGILAGVLLLLLLFSAAYSSTAEAGKTYCVGGYRGQPGHTTPSACNTDAIRRQHRRRGWHYHNLVRRRAGGDCYECWDEEDNTCNTIFLSEHPDFEEVDKPQCPAQSNESKILFHVKDGKPVTAPRRLSLTIGVEGGPSGQGVTGEILHLKGVVRTSDGKIRPVLGGSFRVTDADGNARVVPGSLQSDGTVTGQITVPSTREISVVFEPELPPRGPGEVIAQQREVGKTITVARCGYHATLTAPTAGAVLYSGEPVTLKAALFDRDRRPLASAPSGTRLRFSVQGKTIDTGVNLRASWTPENQPGSGAVTIEVRGEVGGVQVCSLQPVSVTVASVLEFGDPVPIPVGELRGETTGAGVLDLTGAKVKGVFDVSLSTDFDVVGGVLEVDTGAGWVPASEAKILLTTRGAREWPVRIRVGSCPGAQPASEAVKLVLHTSGSDGSPLTLAVPIEVVVVPDSLWKCYWWIAAVLAGAILIWFIIYGFISPFSFGRRVGLQISPEEDMSEGFFHGIRGVRGTGKGFYRHATAYVALDYRITGRAQGALVKLRAQRRRIMISPVSGQTVLREDLDGGWEPIPREEIPLRSGKVYRNEQGSLFFELRKHG